MPMAPRCDHPRPPSANALNYGVLSNESRIRAPGHGRPLLGPYDKGHIAPQGDVWIIDPLLTLSRQAV